MVSLKLTDRELCSTPFASGEATKCIVDVMEQNISNREAQGCLNDSSPTCSNILSCKSEVSDQIKDCLESQPECNEKKLCG